MKKVFRKMVFVPFVLVMLSNCGSSPQAETAQGKSLDTAIQEAAESIEARLIGKSKVALLNFSSTSEQFSQYVLDELSANLVSSRKLVIVDRKEIDLIRSETDFQYSGDVSDESMQEIGKILGAQSIVSGSLTNIGDIYRITIKVITVQSAEITVQYRSDIANDSKVKALLASGGGAGSGSAERQTAQARGGSSGTAQGGAQTPAASKPAVSAASTSAQAEPPGGGDTAINIKNLSTWNAAINEIRNGGNNRTYIINVTGNISVPTINENIFGPVTGITVIIQGNGTISISVNGSLLSIGAGQTVILRNVKLRGRSGNDSPVVRIMSGGIFQMQGSASVTGNTSSANGGVYVDGGTFVMQDKASVSGNTRN